jgi:hypothetical protein
MRRRNQAEIETGAAKTAAVARMRRTSLKLR